MAGESKYERIRRVGIGSYGIVFKCVNRQTGAIVAIKRYSESDNDPIIRKIATREVRMLRQLKHPNLINLIEVFRRKRRLHLVFDYCELTLLDVIEKYSSSCPVALIKKIIWQTVNAISYCHSKNCIHRDIKPENILISKTGVVKLCDFGFARSLSWSARASITKSTATSTSSSDTSKNSTVAASEIYLQSVDNTNNNLNDTNNNNINQNTEKNASRSKRQDNNNNNNEPRLALTEYVATRWYRAPELLVGDAYYGAKIDIWALGCVTSELMRGEPMWPAKTDLEQLIMIKSSLGSLTERQCSQLLAQRVYDKLATDRLVANQAYMPDPLEHKLPLHVGRLGFDFVASCLKMDENSRASAETLLKHPFIHSARILQLSSQGTPLSTTNNLAKPSTNVKQSSSLSNIKPQISSIRQPLKALNSNSFVNTQNVTTVSNSTTTINSQKRNDSQISPDGSSITTNQSVKKKFASNAVKQANTSTATIVGKKYAANGNTSSLLKSNKHLPGAVAVVKSDNKEMRFAELASTSKIIQQLAIKNQLRLTLQQQQRKQQQLKLESKKPDDVIKSNVLDVSSMQVELPNAPHLARNPTKIIKKSKSKAVQATNLPVIQPSANEVDDQNLKNMTSKNTSGSETTLRIDADRRSNPTIRLPEVVLHDSR